MSLAQASTPLARTFAQALIHRITSEEMALPALYDKQEQFVMSEARHAAFVAGIGSGKSWAGAVRAHRAAMGWIGTRRIITPNLGMFTAPTEDMIRKATLRTFLEIADRDIVSHNKNEKLIALRNGSEIYYASTQHPDRLRGPSISWWWGDEAAFYEAVVRKIMIGRLRQHGRLGYDWLTTTPKGRNWVWQTFVQSVPEAAREQYLLIKARSRENTFQDSEVVDMWEREYTGDFAAQELDAEFIAFEGLIYNEFDRGRHVRSVMPQYPRYVAGVDWGFANPGVIVVVGVDSDGSAGVTRLMYERQTRIEEWVNIGLQLRGIYGITSWYCDPSSPDNIRKFVEAGLKAEPANNTVITGINAVKNRLVGMGGDNRPRLTITQDAVHMLNEFESYQWAENRHGLRDEPVKANDHCLIAGTLVTTQRGAIPIEAVTTDDLVLTRMGFKRVIASGMTIPCAATMTVHFSNGVTLTGTDDHKVWVKGIGYIELRALRYADMIEWVDDWSQSACQSSIPKQSFLTASLSADIRTRFIGLIATTIAPLQNTLSRGWDIYIGRSGNRFTEISRKATRSTTRTKTPSTTISTILSAWRKAIILRFTPRNSLSGVNSGSVTTCSGLAGRVLLNGIVLKPAAPGIASLRSGLGNSALLSNESANIVEGHTRLFHDMEKSGSVRITASPHTAGSRASITRPAFVSAAAQSSSAIGTPRTDTAPVHVVAATTNEKSEPVYDLTIEDAHEFFANGILVHNSLDALRYAIMGIDHPKVRKVEATTKTYA